MNCENCNDTGRLAENERGGQAYCDCQVGINLIKEDNKYYFGSEWYPFFNEPEFNKFYGIEKVNT